VRSSTYTLFRATYTVLGGAALAGAALLMLLPLPRQDLGILNGTLYCGPGASSDSALQVMINPDVVNQGDPVSLPSAGQSPTAEQQANARQHRVNIQVCQNAAKTRFILAAAAVIFAIAVGLTLPAILRPKRQQG
jgi:hypothetical protein